MTFINELSYHTYTFSLVTIVLIIFQRRVHRLTCPKIINERKISCNESFWILCLHEVSDVIRNNIKSAPGEFLSPPWFKLLYLYHWTSRAVNVLYCKYQEQHLINVSTGTFLLATGKYKKRG